MRIKIVIMLLVAAFLFCVFVCNAPGKAQKAPMLPGKVRAVFDRYAQKYPQGRLDHVSRVGDRFFLGIIVFPEGESLDVRYLLVGKFREWEPIAEFEKIPY